MAPNRELGPKTIFKEYPVSLDQIYDSCTGSRICNSSVWSIHGVGFCGDRDEEDVKWVENAFRALEAIRLTAKLQRQSRKRR